MARKSEEAGCRLPKAVEFLADLSEEEAAVHSPVVLLKRNEGGQVPVATRTPPTARAGQSLDALLATGRKNFEELLPKLAAELLRSSPNLGIVATAFRDGLLGSGAAALGALMEAVDRELPAPACESCGAAMRRHQRKSKRFTTRIGPVEASEPRSLPDCGGGHFPFDSALGVEGESHAP